MNARYPNIKAEMARHGISYEDIAKIIGISARSVKDKINGETLDFRMSECKKIYLALFSQYKLTFDYLFMSNDDNLKSA